MAHKITPSTPVATTSQVGPINGPGREFGRISGPLLSANLLRNGQDLAFETDLVYLSVNSGFVGFNNSTPVRALDIDGDITTDNLIVDTETDINNSFQVTTNQIYNSLNLPILLQPNQGSNPKIAISGGLNTDNLNFATNVIRGTANSNINFTPYQNPNAVANGDFETGDLTGWTVTGATSTITVADATNSYAGNYALSATSYIQTSTVQQTLSTSPGQTYIITFSLKNVANLYLTTENGQSVMTTEDALSIIALSPVTTQGEADFKIYWNNTVLTGGSPVGAGPTLPYSSPSASVWSYTTYTFTVTATGSDVLKFAFRNDYSVFYIDNISVLQQGTTSGITQINSNTLINGALHATGNITFDGDMVFGDSTSDRISIPAEVASDIIPLTPWNLGSSSLEWNNVWLQNAVLSTALTANTVTTTALNAGNISISANNIGDAVADLNLVTSGSGKVNLNGNALFSGNTINNPSYSNPYITVEAGSFIITTEDSIIIAAEVTTLPFEIFNTGIGYTQFSGTKAVQMPSGTTGQRPNNPQTGTTRYNTSNQNTEIYNGTSWQDIAGISTTTNAENDLTTLWSLILG